MTLTLCYWLEPSSTTILHNSLLVYVNDFMEGCKFADDEDISAWQIVGWKTKIKNYFTTKSERWKDTGLGAFQLYM